MNYIPLILALLIPFCLSAEDVSDSFPLEKDLAMLAATLGVEAKEIQFLERAEFNLVFKPDDRSVKAFRGYVAATDSEIFLILNDRLDARKSDVWSMGIEYVRGVVSTDHQVVVSTHPPNAVVIEFENKAKDLHAGLMNFLIERGVRKDLEPPNAYTLRDFSKPVIGMPYGKPSIFAFSRYAQRGRDVASYETTWHNHANSWDPKNDYYLRSE
jgi:hypothetical protein